MKQTNHKINTKTNRKPACMFLSAAVTTILVLSVTTNVWSGDLSQFKGTLKSVSITDSAGTNSPPIAAFTYTLTGDTITFNGNSSYDPDGSISTYKWNLSNGTIGEGTTFSYTPYEEILNATLTVTDNSSGISINQQSITSQNITDYFSTNSSNDYSLQTGELTFRDGKVFGQIWRLTTAIHNTIMNPDAQKVQATVYYDGGTGSGGVVAGFNMAHKTGYSAFFENGRIYLNSYTNGYTKVINQYTLGNYGPGLYGLTMEINNDQIHIYVDDLLVLTDQADIFTPGAHIGIVLKTSSEETIFVDNLSAE